MRPSSNATTELFDVAHLGAEWRIDRLATRIGMLSKPTTVGSWMQACLGGATIWCSTLRSRPSTARRHALGDLKR